MNIPDDTSYLKHIIDAITDIEESLRGLSENDFKKNKDIKDATIRRIEIIGEAVKNISEKLKKKYPSVQWKKIAGARDIMIHAYFSVDLDIVWAIVKYDLPILKKEILKILKK